MSFPGLQKILVIIGLRGFGMRNPGEWYRALGPGQALLEAGHEVYFAYQHEREKISKALQEFNVKLIVFYRGSNDEDFRFIHKLAKNQGASLVYDVDDAIFDPSITESSGVFAEMPLRDRHRLIRWMESVAECLSACTGAILATDFLRELALPLNPNSHVFRNLLPAWYLTFVKKKQKRQKPALLFYGPGSKMHFYYLEAVAQELAEVLGQAPDLKLVIGGALEIPGPLRSVEDQLIRFPTVSIQTYMKILCEVDWVIAPLTQDSFVEGKSWIKALEAAACGTPWFSSAQNEMKFFQQETGTGVVCRNQDWNLKLKECLEQWDRHAQIAMDRQENILVEYSWKKNVSKYLEILKLSARL